MAEEPVKLNFGEWLPDLPANENPGAIEAKNCIPEEVSYRSINGLASFSDALPGQAAGSYWLRSSANGIFNFAATQDNLFLFDGINAWDNVSKPAAAYSAEIWDFTNFQNRVIATDGATAIQYYDLGVSVAFDDLPGSPPFAAVCGVVRDFVILGDYEIGAEDEAGGFAWCGFNNTELWTPSLSTQSGRRRSRGNGGAVKRIVSGTQGIAFRQDDIISIRYVGPPNVFQFDDITTLHGTPAGRSVAWTGKDIFYYSIDGFKRLNRQTFAITDIGAFRVDRWFLENCAPTEVQAMQATVDRRNKLVFWVFRSSSSSAAFDRILVFNWAANNGRGRWSYAELECEMIGEFASVGYNLDTIGAVLGGNIDSASINVDSEAYSGGAVSLLAFNNDHEAATFSGTPLVAEIDTKEWSFPGRRAYTKSVRPIVESVTGPTIQVAAVTRNMVSSNPVTSGFGGLNSIGQVDRRVDARYHRYRVKISGGFTHAQRVEFFPTPRGR